MPAESKANVQQSENWNTTGGATWVRLQAMLDEQLASLGEAAMERANVASGERALDIGCGCGATTLELARRVGAAGSVIGLDLSEPMLTRAEETAREAAIENVRFVRADAQTHTFAGEPFDLLYSRFGVMFFDDPRAAFSNLLGTLRPHGRMAFVCWRTPEENEWASVMLDVVARHINVDSQEPDAPGPFAFGDGGAVRSILEDAGFSTVAVESLDKKITVGGRGTLDEVAQNLTQFGPIGRAIKRAGVTDTSAIVASLKEVLAPFRTDVGVRMGSATWIVTGSRGP